MMRVLMLVILLAAADARADVTLHGQSTPGVSGGTDRYTMYLRDEQMRIDQLQGAQGEVVESSMIIRFEGSPAGTLFLDHSVKEVTIMPLDALTEAERTAAGAGAGAARQPVVATNETREVMGHTVKGYDFAFDGAFSPASMSAQEMPPEMKDMLNFRMKVSGTAWVAPGLEGAEELAAFYERMAENRMSIGGVNLEPAGAGSGESGADPGISHALTSIMAEIAGKGLPLRTDMTTDVTVDATGPMAGMLKQMMSGVAGSMSYTSEVTSVSTDPVDAELFYDGGLPQDYRQEVLGGSGDGE